MAPAMDRHVGHGLGEPGDPLGGGDQADELDRRRRRRRGGSRRRGRPSRRWRASGRRPGRRGPGSGRGACCSTRSACRVASSRKRPMCQTWASGIRSSRPSAIPSPARRIGTIATGPSSSWPAASPSGVRTVVGRVGRSAVASAPRSIARFRTRSRKAGGGVSADRRAATFCRTSGCVDSKTVGTPMPSVPGSDRSAARWPGGQVGRHRYNDRGRDWQRANAGRACPERSGQGGREPAMALGFNVLGSGSKGNSTLVRLDGAGVLLDAGLGPRSLAARLEAVGSGWDGVRGAILTHTHGDHAHDVTLRWLARLADSAALPRRPRRRGWPDGPGSGSWTAPASSGPSTTAPSWRRPGSGSSRSSCRHSGPTFGFRLQGRLGRRGRPSTRRLPDRHRLLGRPGRRRPGGRRPAGRRVQPRRGDGAGLGAVAGPDRAEPRAAGPPVERPGGRPDRGGPRPVGAGGVEAGRPAPPERGLQPARPGGRDGPDGPEAGRTAGGRPRGGAGACRSGTSGSGRPVPVPGRRRPSPRASPGKR